jgi:pimeloyl-ACP methyl ester carboxylesterase
MRTPVVLIHGMWSTGNTLEPIKARLEQLGYQCSAPTLPHHENRGDAKAVGTMSLKDYISFLEKYISDQNFETPPLLVGHSLGGLLAQMLAARIPTVGLALFAPAAPPGGIPAVSLSQLRFFFPITARPFWWKRSHRPASSKGANTALFNNLAPARQRELFDSLVPESGRVLFELSFPQLDRTKAGAHDYSKVQVPLAILHGTKDGVVRRALAVRRIREFRCNVHRPGPLADDTKDFLIGNRAAHQQRQSFVITTERLRAHTAGSQSRQTHSLRLRQWRA